MRLPFQSLTNLFTAMATLSRSTTRLNSIFHIHRSQVLFYHKAQFNVLGSLINLNERNSAPHNPLVYAHFVRGYSEGTEELGRAKRLWMKIGGLMKAFMNGTKALYRDVKRMYQLQTRTGDGSYVISKRAPKEVAPGKLDFALNREELQFVYQVSYECISSPILFVPTGII